MKVLKNVAGKPVGFACIKPGAELSDTEVQVLADYMEYCRKRRARKCKKRGFHNFKSFIDPRSGGFVKCKDCGLTRDCEDPDGDSG